MGYDVNGEGEIQLKSGQEAAAYQALCDLNKLDGAKTGGSFSRGEQTACWFAWMPENYPEQTETVQDVLHLLGFEFYGDPPLNDTEPTSFYYDSKMGQEGLFLEALAPFCEVLTVDWRGEDGEMWRDALVDGEFVHQQGKVVYE